MTWFKVDDTLATHPKARMAGLPAMGLWAVAGAYASQHLTDGYVPAWYVQTWPQGARLAQRLVDAGLWCVAEGGWRYHQWEERQPTKAKVEEEREKTRARQQAWRDARRDSGVSNSVSNGVTDGVSNASPTRPDPTRPKEEEQKNPSTAGAADASFNKFWEAYPRKVGKGPARTAWAKALRKASEHDLAAALHVYRRAVKDWPIDKIAHPATWLNREPWHDDPAALAGGTSNANGYSRPAPVIAYESPAQVPAEPLRWES